MRRSAERRMGGGKTETARRERGGYRPRRAPCRLFRSVLAVAHAPGSLARHNPGRASGHRRVPEVGQFVLARRAFIMAQDETFDVTCIAPHLHAPAQVIRAARRRILTLVLMRRPRDAPRDAVLSLVIRDPASVDLALGYTILSTRPPSSTVNPTP
jgi:hypothetical protein